MTYWKTCLWTAILVTTMAAAGLRGRHGEGSFICCGFAGPYDDAAAGSAPDRGSR